MVVPPTSTDSKVRLASRPSGVDRLDGHIAAGRRIRLHDAPGVGCRARIEVAGFVNRAHRQRVRAAGEPGIGLRRAAGDEAGAVERAPEPEVTGGVCASVPEKVNVASVSIVADSGPESMLVVGAAVSIVQV